MTLNDLNLLVRRGLEFKVKENSIWFRAPHLLWYQNHPEGYTEVTKEKFAEMTPDELYDAVTAGMDVEQITRVTGYFSKVRGWNPGKRAELRDRSKHEV